MTAPAVTAPAVEVREVSVRFGGLLALDAVSLSVERGEIVGLIGPNGAGKTTLLNTVAGAIRPDAGRVLLAGDDVTGAPAHQRARRGLRRMFQHGGLVSDETVRTNLLIAQHAVGASDPVARAYELLAEVGVEHLADELVADLPAGLARLVELACVMAGEPTVALLDEPSSGLSAEEIDRLARVLVEHDRRGGFATLVVAHDMRFVMGLAQRIVVLADGRVLAEGPPADVQADADVRALYFGGVS